MEERRISPPRMRRTSRRERRVGVSSSEFVSVSVSVYLGVRGSGGEEEGFSE